MKRIFFSNRSILSLISYIFVVAVVFVILLAALNSRRMGEFPFTRIQMGTIVEITVDDFNYSHASIAASEAFDEIARLESILSSYKTNSDISRINKWAGKKYVRVNPETLYLVEQAVRISEESKGAFDPTIGSLGDLWSFSGEERPVPDNKSVHRLLPLVNYRSIVTNKGSGEVGLNKQGQKINLGGIAKGYIVGRAVQVLKKEGVRRGIVKAGGDMVVFDSDSKKPFVIGVQHPRDPDKIIARVTVFNRAVASSGDYERYMIKNGIRYHHILDPATGFPAWRSQAVTIIADDPATADAISTAVFVLGPEKGIGLINRLSGVEGFVVGSSGQISISRGLKGVASILEEPKSGLITKG